MPTFDEIYEQRLWGGGSGGGSDPAVLQPYLDWLAEFIKKHDIHHITDIGCGDWRYMSQVDLTGVRYTGIDVVRDVIETNKARYAGETIVFWCTDYSENRAPTADLVIVKDVLQHWSNRTIQKFLPSLSYCKWALIVNDLGSNDRNVVDGGYAGLDITKPPFSLKGETVMELPICGMTKRFVLMENPYV